MAACVQWRCFIPAAPSVGRLKTTNAVETSHEHPADVHQRILYVLHPECKGDRIYVEVVSARQMEDGVYGATSTYRFSNFFNHILHRFVLQIDLDIIKRAKPSNIDSASFTPLGDRGVTIMKLMLQTGRCHWKNVNSSPRWVQHAPEHGSGIPISAPLKSFACARPEGKC